MSAKILDAKGLKFKLWTYFVLFAAGIMVVLWLLQIIFLNTFYQSMKLHQLESIGNRMVAAYGSDDFEETLFDTSYRNGLMIRIYDEAGNRISNADIFSDFRDPHNAGRDELYEMKERLAQSGSDRVAFINGSNRMGGGAHVAVFAAQLCAADGSPIYLNISTPLAPVDATTQVLQNQLLIVTALSLLFGFILSYFIARRMSDPLTRLTHTAAQLATGDYGVEFEKGGYTEINELADALNYTTQELSKTNELRRDLVANVSHDLRTPLTIIKSYAEMIRDLSGNNPEKRAAHTQVIIDEADRLSALVSDLLDLSRMESGTAPMEPSVFDLSETTRRMVQRFDVLAEGEGFTFSVHCVPDAMVEADESRMEQVIYNLISNAVNYTGADKRVSVSVTSADGHVHFEVTDTGKGIPPEELGQIWERYYRAGSKTNRRGTKGTGIGLAIVKNILAVHHARYGVHSEVGHGSTFWFELDAK